MSQFETASRQPFALTTKQLAGLPDEYLDYLSKLTGQTRTKVGAEGIRIEGGKLFAGQSGQEWLSHASLLRFRGASPRLPEAYMRSLGVRIPQNVLDASTGLLNQSEGVLPIGGQSMLSHIGRQVGAIGTEGVSRFNRLLRYATSGGERLPLVGGMIGRLKFNVDEGPGLKMFGKLVGKYGLIAPAMYLGYQTIDYHVRNMDILNDTILDQGVTAGVANIWAKGHMALAQAAETTGLYQYGREQEAIAPGSTDLSRLAAFPIMGVLGGIGLGYGHKLFQTAKGMYSGLSFLEAEAQANIMSRGFPVEGILGRISDQIQGAQMIEWPAALVKPDDKAIYTVGGKTFKQVGKDWRLLGRITPTKLAALGGAAIGALAVAPFLLGAIAPDKSSEELRRIYSGEQEVPVRRGRWWTLGRSAYEGQNINYYRQSWVARANNRAKEKGLWAALEEQHGRELSPLEKFWTKEFTHEWELANYYNRPYPISGGAFEDVPFIGPLIAGTAGNLIKEPMLMHTGEWQGSGGETLHLPPAFGEQRFPEYGEQLPGAPISPYGFKNTFGETFYRVATEMPGLPGFLGTAIKERITGTPDFFDQEAQLESARRAFGAERSIWDVEMGDVFGLNETFRRLYPHRRRQIDLENPIRNTQADWLPGPGEKGPNLLYGDPYSKIPFGEERLPGPGYESRFPELAGISPEEYPLIHQYKILSDVGLYTDKFKETESMIRTARNQGTWSEYEENIYQQVREQLKARKRRKEFYEYQYRDETLSPIGRKLADVSKENLAAENQSVIGKALGSYWETLAHNAETPLEFLTPVSPASKLVHMRTAIEDYEKTQVFGTMNAFWQHPIKHFIKPFVQTTGEALGANGIPADVQERRNIMEYFDILEYVKAKKMENMARSMGDAGAAGEFEKVAGETLTGLNPYAMNFQDLYRALPRADRDYFQSFTDADLKERERIKELVPEDQQGLFAAMWQMKDTQEATIALKKDLLSGKEEDKAREFVKESYTTARTQGFPVSQDLWGDYLSERLEGETYPEWYRRTRLIPEKIKRLGLDIPGPDWIGWHPYTDLDDLKLKVVENLALDMFDFDIWPAQIRAAAHRPWINNEAVEEILSGDENTDQEEVRRRVTQVMKEHGFKNIQVMVSDSTMKDTELDLKITEDRTLDLEAQLREMEMIS